MALTYILTLIKFASIQINPNRTVNFSAVFAIVLFLPCFSTLAQPPAGNSSTLELLPLTKPDRERMPGPSRKAAAWLPILVILVAMTSIQSGASLAKSLFPVVGPRASPPASGAGNADSGGGVQAMAATFLPAQRVPLYYGFGARGDELSLYLSLQRIPLGVSYRPAGGGAVWFAARWILSAGGAGDPRTMVSSAAGANVASPARCSPSAPGRAGRSIF